MVTPTTSFSVMETVTLGSPSRSAADRPGRGPSESTFTVLLMSWARVTSGVRGSVTSPAGRPRRRGDRFTSFSVRPCPRAFRPCPVRGPRSVVASRPLRRPPSPSDRAPVREGQHVVGKGSHRSSRWSGPYRRGRSPSPSRRRRAGRSAPPCSWRRRRRPRQF